MMKSHEKCDFDTTVNQILKEKYARVAETEITVAKGERRNIKYRHVDRKILGDSFRIVVAVGSCLLHFC